MEINRRLILQTLTLGALLSTAACNKSKSSAQTSHSSAKPKPEIDFSAYLNPGRHVIYSYPGKTLPDELLTKAHEGTLGGVIFFTDNITSASQLASITKELQTAAVTGKSKKRIILTTDQEGGMVNRIPQNDLSEKQIGESSDPVTTAANEAKLQAKLLKQCGININLSPVLGVYQQPGDFLDRFQRSYSDDPKIAAKAGSSYIESLQNSGVIATGKHFPGLGSASSKADTDETSVVINDSLNHLQNINYLPFIDAIKANVGLIMPSWAIYPSLDPNNPAGLSSKIIRDVLRKQLEFNGVTITDALEAGALGSIKSISDRAYAAKKAGNDLLCCSNRSIAEGDEAAEGISAALADGKLSKQDFDDSSKRLAILGSRLTF